MSKEKIVIIWCILTCIYAQGYCICSQSDSSIYSRYNSTLNTITNKNTSFKQAVNLVEYCYLNDSTTFNDFDSKINGIKAIITLSILNSKASKYHSIDSSNFFINYRIYQALKDTTKFVSNFGNINSPPFTYNFTDPFGTQDFTNTFVTKLLQTHKGNCRSLAYLYKILADELGAKCWLSLAPNHIYIKNYSQKIGWYNTELTSGTFPTDAWIMTTGYVNPEAIKSGLYMDTLSNQQAIALCVLDLAKGYERQTHNYYDGFILKCCDLVLQYHPVNPMALLLRAETLKKVYLHEKEIHFPKPTVTESPMTEVYITLAKLGYREMSDKMYQKWLKSIKEQKEKYSNKKVVKPSLKK